jgi:hypothetical protein
LFPLVAAVAVTVRKKGWASGDASCPLAATATKAAQVGGQDQGHVPGQVPAEALARGPAPAHVPAQPPGHAQDPAQGRVQGQLLGHAPGQGQGRRLDRPGIQAPSQTEGKAPQLGRQGRAAVQQGRGQGRLPQEGVRLSREEDLGLMENKMLQVFNDHSLFHHCFSDFYFIISSVTVVIRYFIISSVTVVIHYFIISSMTVISSFPQ